MQTIDLKIPYTEVTLILDSLRHYIKYIENLDESNIDDDILADLLNDNENIKGLEKSLSLLLAEKNGAY